ncbi:tetraprenyl-beta-curcumene synthase family protein [Moorella sp. ACPs]|uniref:tetraprenyl-beta-curcumene synthase family protein n=1 Tax=Neomoorella carbonis TaxID=3062783 RepID=UPI0032548E2D
MPKEIRALVILGRLLFRAFPAVDRELKRWQHLAACSPEPELRRQALASLTQKKFHCQGGSVYTTLSPRYRYGEQLLQAIVSLQTISDYLDNLCDRAGVVEEKAFRQLHLAFTDALTPGMNGHDYYAGYPYCRDGGYLQALVHACRQALMVLPGYKTVQEEILHLAGLYCCLQVTKHIEITRRQEQLQSWLEPLLGKNPIYWWELAAATGSTLGIFALMAAAAREEVTASEVARLKDAYFPWIGGLHILLDYFIDQQEDRQGGDLNFCAFYRDEEEAGQRLQFFLEKSLEKAQKLPDPAFHLLVVQGLPALYLSDAKVAGPKYLSTRETVLRSAGAFSKKMYLLCKTLRRVGVI